MKLVKADCRSRNWRGLIEHDNTPKTTNVEIEFSFLLAWQVRVKNLFILFIYYTFVKKLGIRSFSLRIKGFGEMRIIVK
jgi:hypothetical protein